MIIMLNGSSDNGETINPRRVRTMKHENQRTVRFITAAIIIAAIGGSLGTASAAVTASQKCQAAKLKEVGKYDACRFKAEATAVIKDTTVDTTKCDAKFSENWAKIETKAAGACSTTGDAVAIGGDVATHVGEIADALAPLLVGCDPLAQNCSGGQGCYNLGTSNTACASPGAVPIDGGCVFPNDCGVGAHCSSSGVCESYCSIAVPVCPVGTTCTSLQLVSFPDVGNCD